MLKRVDILLESVADLLERRFIAQALKTGKGKPGDLRKALGVRDGDKIDVRRAEQTRKSLQRKAKKAKLNDKDLRLLRQLNLFLNVLSPASQARRKR